MNRAMRRLQNSSVTIVKRPQPAKDGRLWPAFVILEHGVDSVNALASFYSQITKARGRGAPKHEDQDLLRVMVVMAGSCLDACLKRIVRQCYPALALENDRVREQAKKHIAKHIIQRTDNGSAEQLAEALISGNVSASLLELVSSEITKGSLQSVEEIRRVLTYVGLGDMEIPAQLREACSVRKKIVHEMDATDLAQHKKRRRIQRKREQMIEYARQMIELARNVLSGVDSLLVQAKPFGGLPMASSSNAAPRKRRTEAGK